MSGLHLVCSVVVYVAATRKHSRHCCLMLPLCSLRFCFVVRGVSGCRFCNFDVCIIYFIRYRSGNFLLCISSSHCMLYVFVVSHHLPSVVFVYMFVSSLSFQVMGFHLLKVPNHCTSLLNLFCSFIFNISCVFQDARLSCHPNGNCRVEDSKAGLLMFQAQPCTFCQPTWCSQDC